jgi:hypothetical protein
VTRHSCLISGWQCPIDRSAGRPARHRYRDDLPRAGRRTWVAAHRRFDEGDRPMHAIRCMTSHARTPRRHRRQAPLGAAAQPVGESVSGCRRSWQLPRPDRDPRPADCRRQRRCPPRTPAPSPDQQAVQFASGPDRTSVPEHTRSTKPSTLDIKRDSDPTRSPVRPPKTRTPNRRTMESADRVTSADLHLVQMRASI